MNNFSPFPYLGRFILDATSAGFALLPVPPSPCKNISCKNDRTRRENLVNFFSFFKAQPLPQMDCLLLLQEIVNL